MARRCVTEEPVAAQSGPARDTHGATAVLATALRGLRARPLLTGATLVLAVVAVAAAVIGPTYRDAATRSYVVAQLADQPPVTTGLTFDYHSPPNSTESVDEAIRTALTTTSKLSGPAYDVGHPIVWDPLPPPRLPGVGTEVTPTLVAAPGACRHVRLEGRCPTKPGEIAVLVSDATTLGLHLGSHIVTGAPYRYVVTGLYRPTPAGDSFWFGNTRLQTIPAVGLPKPQPARPAPWITVAQTIQDRYDTSWYVSVDQRLALPPSLTPDDVHRAGARALALTREADAGDLPLGFDLEPGNTLYITAHQLLSQRAVVGATVTPAVVSLLLVTTLLLIRLLAAATDARRGELALAALRGYERRRLWWLGMVEPLLVIGAALPLGVAVGYACSRLLAMSWLAPGLPVHVPPSGLLAALAVVALTSVCAAVVVRVALNEPLAEQISGVRRPARASRTVTIARILLAAVAVAALVTALGRGAARSPDATDMALPVLLAMGAGVLSAIAVTAVSGAWVRVTAPRRALAPYVASRTIRRRRTGTVMVLPVTAATAIAVFALGISGTAAHWRADAAATRVGAGLSYPTRLSLSQAVALTHTIDPQGRWLMAAGLISPDAPSSDLSLTVPRVVVDAPRLGRVAAWPPAWTPTMSAATVGRRLAPTRPAVVLTGRRISLRVDDRIRGDYRRLTVAVTVLNDRGNTRQILFGPVRPGRTTVTRRLPGCLGGCRVQQLDVAGPAALPEAMRGHVTLDALRLDGHTSSAFADSGWRAADLPLGIRSAVRHGQQQAGGRLRVSVRAPTNGFWAAITPTDVPETIPALWGDHATVRDRLVSGGDQGATYALRAIGTATSLPIRGPVGVLMDYSTFIRHATVQYGTEQTWIWARSDTPETIRDALATHGMTEPDTLARARHALDEDAFALALRLYGVVTVVVILLALAGLGVSLAVQLPARRRDVAALRVIGVRRRTLLLGVLAELLVVLGVAALAGLCAGWAAHQVVVRSVTLGFVDSAETPPIPTSLDVAAVGTLSVALLAALVVVAGTVAALTVRAAHPATLRDEAR